MVKWVCVWTSEVAINFYRLRDTREMGVETGSCLVARSCPTLLQPRGL